MSATALKSSAWLAAALALAACRNEGVAMLDNTVPAAAGSAEAEPVPSPPASRRTATFALG